MLDPSRASAETNLSKSFLAPTLGAVAVAPATAAHSISSSKTSAIVEKDPKVAAASYCVLSPARSQNGKEQICDLSKFVNVKERRIAAKEGAPRYQDADPRNILSLPRAQVIRLAKRVLPPDARIDRRAITTLSRLCAFFLLALNDASAAAAVDAGRKSSARSSGGSSKNRRMLTPLHVLAGLRSMGCGDLAQRIQDFDNKREENDQFEQLGKSIVLIEGGSDIAEGAGEMASDQEHGTIDGKPALDIGGNIPLLEAEGETMQLRAAGTGLVGERKTEKHEEVLADIEPEECAKKRKVRITAENGALSVAVKDSDELCVDAESRKGQTHLFKFERDEEEQEDGKDFFDTAMGVVDEELLKFQSKDLSA